MGNLVSSYEDELERQRAAATPDEWDAMMASGWQPQPVQSPYTQPAENTTATASQSQWTPPAIPGISAALGAASAPPVPAISAAINAAVGPGGRTYDQVTGTDYLNEAEMAWYRNGGRDLAPTPQIPGISAVLQAPARDDLAYANDVATWQDAPYVGPVEAAQQAGEYANAVEQFEAIGQQQAATWNPTAPEPNNWLGIPRPLDIARSAWGAARSIDNPVAAWAGVPQQTPQGFLDTINQPYPGGPQLRDTLTDALGGLGALYDSYAGEAQTPWGRASGGPSAESVGREIGQATPYTWTELAASPLIGFLPGVDDVVKAGARRVVPAAARAGAGLADNVAGYGARALGAGDAVVPTGAAQRTIAPAAALHNVVPDPAALSRFHQTSPESAEAIRREGFSLARRGSGANDVLPIGVNTKTTDASIPLQATGEQMRVYGRPGLNLKQFGSRDEAEAWLRSQDSIYNALIGEMKGLDATYGSQWDALWKQLDTLPDAEQTAALDRMEGLTTEWTARLDAIAPRASARATEVMKSQGFDGMEMGRDTGGLFGNRVTDNTIIFDPANVTTTQPTRLQRTPMPRVVSPTEGEGLLPSGGGAPRPRDIPQPPAGVALATTAADVPSPAPGTQTRLTSSEAASSSAAAGGRALTVDGRRIVAGRVTGLPPGITNDADLALLDDTLKNLAAKGEKGRFWYEASGGALKRIAHNDPVEGDRLARITAITSIDTSVEGQAPFILRAWSQLRETDRLERVSDFKGARYGSVSNLLKKAQEMSDEQWDRQVIDWLDKGDAGNQKIANFYLDLLDEIDPERAMRLRVEGGATATIDRWMNRSFGFGDSRTAEQYRFMGETVVELARQLTEETGTLWTPKQVQAAIWVGNRMDDGVVEAGIDYGKSLERHGGMVSWESAPGIGSQRSVLLDGLDGRPLQEHAEFHYAIVRAFQGENGEDILAKAMRLPVLGEFADDVAAHTQVGVGFSVGGKSLDPDQVRAISDYAAAKAYLLQDSNASWTRPIADAPKYTHNGVDVNLGRRISQEEKSALAQTLGGDFVVVPSGNGAWVYRKVNDFDFAGRADPKSQEAAHLKGLNTNARKQVESAVTAQWATEDVKIDLSTFATDGEHFTHDWMVNPDGKSLLAGRSALQRPEVRAAIDSLGRRIRAVDDEYAARWRQPQQLPRNAAGQHGPGGRAPFGEEPATPPAAALRAQSPSSSPPVGQGAVPPPASAAGAGGQPPTAVMDAPPPPGPPPTPPTGTGGGGDEFAGNIRLSKYPDDIREPIAQWANDNPDAVQAARRGVIPDAEVKEMARTLVEDMGGDFNKIQKQWKPGEAWNAEEIAAIRGTLSERTQAVIDAARLPDSTENQLKLAEAILEQQRVQQIVHGVTAEAGRALRAFRTQADAALSAGDVREARELLQRAIGTSDPEKVGMLAKSLEALNDIDPAKANKLIRDIHKPDFWDKLHYYWMNSILSGPITQGRNIMGNIGTTMYTPFQRIGAAAIEQPLAAIQGRQAERFFQEAPAFVVGMLRGLPEGINGAITTAKTGISPRAAAKMEIRPRPIGGIAGRIIGIPTTGLGVADEFFSAINYRASLHADAVRMARMEGLKGTALTDRISSLVADPPPALMKSATGKAEDLVFRGDPGELARAAAFLRQKTPGGRYIMPFLNTPAALLKYGIKNSPLGLLDRGAWTKALAGNPEGADELSRAFMGSSIAAGLSTLVATGVIDITAAAPVNSAERDRFFREGKMPFSVKIPGVGWVEYKQLPMLDTTFTLVASAVDGIRRGEDVQGIASQAAANIATNLLDKSYMSGIGDLFDAVQDPLRYAERYATRQASGMIPFSGLNRQTAGFFDQTVRDPEGLEETFKTQIPGLSKTVPARLTAFGEDARKGLPSPIQVREAKQSDVDAVLEELGMEVGFVGDFAALKLLPADEQREIEHLYQQVAGKNVYLDLVDLIAADAWKKADQSEKQEMLDKTVTSSRSEVRAALTALIKRRVGAQ